MKKKDVNLERGMPRVDEARRRLVAIIEEARRERVNVLKVIHGYGSSGVGGALRTAVRASLRRRRSEGKVRRVIHGEVWSVLDETSRALLEEYPELSNDSDLSRGNLGITIVELVLEREPRGT